MPSIYASHNGYTQDQLHFARHDKCMSKSARCANHKCISIYVNSPEDPYWASLETGLTCLAQARLSAPDTMWDCFAIPHASSMACKPTFPKVRNMPPKLSPPIL